MSIPQDKIIDLRVSQLGMLQANIARVAGYGATIKNWCITVATAVCGFSMQNEHGGVALLALLPIFIFAFIDAEYLRVERQFRSAFDQSRRESWDVLPTFEVSPDRAAKIGLPAILCSWSILSFYLPVAASAAIVTLVAVFIFHLPF